MPPLRALLLPALSAFLACQAAAGSSIPDFRWMVMGAPLSPTSYEECNAFNQKFNDIVQTLNQQHEECLQNAPRDERNEGGSCSKASCQGLHDARIQASKRASEQSRICSERLSAYMEQKRQEEADRRRREDEARKRREQAERDAREEEARYQRRKQAAADEERREQAERENKARQAQREREEREQGYRERQAERERKNREALAAAEADRREREARERQAAAERYQREAQLAAERARQEAAQRERNQRDQALYDKLVRELKDAQEKASLALDFARNPFTTLADQAGGKLNSALIGLAVDSAMGDLQDKPNPFYDQVADVTDKARSRALAGNPFAERVSGTAMEVVHGMHRRALGALDQAALDMRRLDSGASASNSGSGTMLRSSPPPRGGGGSDTRPAASNPFAGHAAERPVAAIGGQDDATEVAHAGSTPSPALYASNPFSASTTFIYTDPDTRKSYIVPSDHVLYRDPKTGTLSTRRLADLKDAAGDDPSQGEQGCSRTGLGRVTPACEQKRREWARLYSNNPFATR